MLFEVDFDVHIHQNLSESTTMALCVRTRLYRATDTAESNVTLHVVQEAHTAAHTCFALAIKGDFQ